MRKTLVLATATAALAVAGTAPALRAQVYGAEIGAAAPSFSLIDTHGDEHALADYQGEWVVLEWLNYECPYVGKHYNSGNMQGLQEKYTGKGVRWFAIVSSAPGQQGYYEPARMNAISEEQGSKATAVLYDPDGVVGRLYGAKTTPQMIVIDPQGTLLYNGAIDDRPSSRPSSLEGAHNYLVAALEEAMAGMPVSTPTSKPYGCSVKYK
ncbi:MAG: thioredoxin family protein [Gemmatimonadota bacterium]|nr:MAG: thioredoxin family protein [Gemmatimonadota bacterium]